MKLFFDFIDNLLPGWVWFFIVLFLLFVCFGYSTKLSNEKHRYDALQTEYAGYKLDVTQKALVAAEQRRDTELHNFRNSERIASEQNLRENVAAAERTRLLARERGVRDELAAFRAETGRDAASGNVAGLAAKAATATELYESCGREYRSMAAEAEAVRIQAVGLWQYIRGNSLCSTPFGTGAPEPAK